MALAGLVDPDAYARDPALKSRIQVVPFGMPSEPPPPPEPGLLPEGRVLVWGSGLWNWLDPLTPMRALEHLPGDVRLVFMGTRRPGLVTSPQDAYADLVREQAERMGLLGERVHFNEGWVPYAERGRWLTGAALGVSAQPDHLEARFAHRTRLLDYLWAGLPVVTTGGDVLSEMIGSRGLGRAVPPADPERFAAACSELLEDDGERQAARDRIAEVAPSLRWEEVARPLVEWCAEPPPPRPRRRAFLARANARQYRHALADSMARDGPRTAIARVLRRIGRSLPSRG
jgi:glycosyltransferase involved in cell wall biosynthesis